MTGAHSLDLTALLALLNLNVVLQVIGAGLGLLGQRLVNNQNWLGFVCWLGSNAALIWLQFRVELFVLVLLHTAYFALCVEGLVKWRRARRVASCQPG